MMRLTPVSMTGLAGFLRSKIIVAPLMGLSCALALTGCPLPDNGGNGAKLTMLLAADDSAFTSTKDLGTKARVVQQNEIDSLFVNVDEIRLRRTVEGGSELVTVFADPIQINLLDLVGVNDVLDSAVVPAGSYTEVQMSLSTPQLALASDPATVLENVALPDGGNLTVAANFTATDNGAGLLVLQLGSISLVSLDDGSYQLVPDLQVDLFDSSVEAQAIGVISAVDAAANTFVLTRDAAELTVNFEGARIFKPSDFDTPSGSAADLVVGLKIFASGTLSVEGNLLGDILVIFPDPPANNSHEEFSIQLNGTGTELNAHGKAEYETEGARLKFKIEAEDLAYSGIVDVWVDGVLIASVDTASDEHGDVRFRLDTRVGDTVPVVTPESLVELLAGGTADVLLSSTAPSNGGGDDSGDDSGDDNGDDSGDDSGDDNGGDTSGSDDTGVDDNGGDTSGSDDAGVDDNGGDTSGSDDTGVDG